MILHGDRMIKIIPFNKRKMGIYTMYVCIYTYIHPLYGRYKNK